MTDKDKPPQKLITYLDQTGIFLSSLCAIHCLIMPFFMLSLPIMARYYLANPLFHFIMAAILLPLGFYSFISGAMKHRNFKVLFLGIPGLLLISIVPVLVHNFKWQTNEVLWVGLGSILLVTAHWINRKTCLLIH
jgi:hypothetical protein